MLGKRTSHQYPKNEQGLLGKWTSPQYLGELPSLVLFMLGKQTSPQYQSCQFLTVTHTITEPVAIHVGEADKSSVPKSSVPETITHTITKPIAVHVGEVDKSSVPKTITHTITKPITVHIGEADKSSVPESSVPKTVMHTITEPVAEQREAHIPATEVSPKSLLKKGEISMEEYKLWQMNRLFQTQTF